MMKDGILLAIVVFLCSIAGEAQTLVGPPMRLDRDDKHIEEPPVREISEIFDPLRNTWLRHFDPGYTALRLRGRPALNVNAWDDVPDSSWFQGRIGRRSLSRQEIVRGPAGERPEPGSWRVVKLKTAGYTPGLQIKDEAGRRYILKFDLPDAPERNSAAERIGTLIMHAAGYNVPHNTIVRFRASDLTVDDEAEYEDAVGRERPMTTADLEEALSRVKPDEGGYYRGTSSLFIPGRGKGAFPYWGVRGDDPNDLIPHELRRELRGLRVIASWFNHVDVKETNTYDSYVTESGRSFLRHYFIDFGSSMGSGNFMNGPCRVGHEYIFDASGMIKSFLTLGIWQRPWDAHCPVEHAEVGRFGSELFDPAGWKPNYPNLAFQEMDEGDAYWGAKIVSAFDDDLIQALVAEGAYARSAVRDHVARTFRARRDKITRYWFDAVTPLEDVELHMEREGWIFRFRDLAIEKGLVSPSDRRYRFLLKEARDLTLIEKGHSDEGGVIRSSRPGDLAPAPVDRFGRAAFLLLEIRSNRREGGDALPLWVVIGRQNGDSGLRILGLKHAPRAAKPSD